MTPAWEPGQWRELADGKVVRLGRRVDGDLWTIEGGYEVEQPSRLLDADEARAWEELSDRPVLFAASDLDELVRH